MKIRSVVLLFVAAVLVGCAPLEKETKVDNNVFSARQLFLKIRISDDFEYIGSEGEAENTDFCHVFVDHDGVAVKRVIIMECRYMFPSVSLTGQWYYSWNPFKGVKGVTDLGKIELDGNQYYYVIKAGTTNRDWSVAKYIVSKGYSLPRFIMEKGVTRIIQGNNEYQIFYIEDIGDIGIPPDSWCEKDGLTDGQRDYLDNFNERFLTSIEFM